MTKVAQCRYCPNSSNEGPGVWFDDGQRWICIICFNELQKNLREGKRETRSGRKG